jgi:hypothetical protein
VRVTESDDPEAEDRERYWKFGRHHELRRVTSGSYRVVLFEFYLSRRWQNETESVSSEMEPHSLHRRGVFHWLHRLRDKWSRDGAK